MARHERSRWVGTQLRVSAVSGLERYHSEPFVRLISTEAADSDGSQGDEATGGVARASESASKPVERLPERRSGCYTALWSHNTSSDSSKMDECSFELSSRADWVELQVWNRFASGFDVFLGKTALSLEQLRAQSVAEDGRKDACQSTGCMWVPLQVPSRHFAPDLRGLKLAAQLAVDFLYDDRVARIRRQIRGRNALKAGKDGGSVALGEGGSADQPSDSVADPTFAFTPPFLPVEWSVVASASVRQLFFHNDVERVADFRELVLYGDVARELAGQADDDGDDAYALHVDPGHLAAFQVAQFAAQYLSHCVDSLDSRVDEYSDQLRSLTDAAQRLRQRNRSLVGLVGIAPLAKKHKRERLEQERDQLALVVQTYESVGQRPGGAGDATVAVLPSDRARLGVGLDVKPERAEFTLRMDSSTSPVKPSMAISAGAIDNPVASSLSAKKPAFLMTWEERERERHREKESTKAQRVQEEQRRLQQRLDERAELDRREATTARRRDESARVLQRFVRRQLWKRRWTEQRQTRALSTRAAVVIQARVRQWRLSRAFPHVRERLKQEREQRWMSVEEARTTQCLLVDGTAIDTSNSPRQHDDGDGAPSALEAMETPPTEDVELMVATWRQLRRAVRREARTRGRNGDCDVWAVFRALDARRDGVIDRAELRRGARERFGLQLNRKLTRGVLALIRGKAGEPPRPLVLTLDQFIRGLDLTLDDSVRISGSSDICDGLEKRDSVVVGEEASRSNRGLKTYQDVKPAAEFSDETTGEAEEGDSIDQRLEAVARAVQALRSAVNTAARNYLAATGSLGQTPSYREFRAALTQVFASFDSDGNGRLDIRELNDCLQSIGVAVTENNLALVRECFCSTPTDSGDDEAVTIAEFISFVLSDAARADPTEELGLLGFRVRAAVLNRLERAQAHLESKGESASTEDALRWMFRSAYPGKRSSCPLREFARVLRTVKGLKALSPAQIARVAARLDRDGDQSISFVELMAWLRLAPDTSASMDSSSTVTEPLGHRSGFRSVLRDAAMKVQRLREWLTQVASTLKGDSGAKTYTKMAQASALFDHVDANASGKIACDELETFVRTLPPELTQLAGVNDVADLAEQLVDMMDLSGNGVVTRDEWLRFTMDAHAPVAEEFAVRVALRRELESLFPTADCDVIVSRWLERLPGAIPTVASSSQDVHHLKIRVGEFKTAVRKAIETSGGGGWDAASSSPAAPLVASAVDAATKQLDSDGSGWITTAKLLRWLFPTRDLEELLRLLRSRWRHQLLSNHASSSLTPAQRAEELYSLFDADGNGCLARRELKSGFSATLGLEFAERELEELVTAFDVDGNQVWSRQEFLDFAQLIVQGSVAVTNNDEGQVKSSVATRDREGAAGSDSERSSGDDEPLLLASASASSEPSTPRLVAESASAAYSDASFQALSGSGTSPTRLPQSPPVYDDDFDE